MAIVNKTIDDSATGTGSAGDYEVELLNVPADKTYAIGAYKNGYFTNQGLRVIGKIELIDIGLEFNKTSDYKLLNYDPMDSIKAPMAV